MSLNFPSNRLSMFLALGLGLGLGLGIGLIRFKSGTDQATPALKDSPSVVELKPAPEVISSEADKERGLGGASRGVQERDLENLASSRDEGVEEIPSGVSHSLGSSLENRLEGSGLSAEEWRKAWVEKHEISKISTALVGALGLNGEDHDQRLASVEKFRSAAFGEAEWSVLSDYLSARLAPDLEENAIRNDLLQIAIQQNPPLPSVGALVLKVMNDENQERVWREYVLQQVPLYYEVRWPADQGYPEKVVGYQRLAFQAAMRRVLKQFETPLAGTAMLGWERLSGNYHEFPPDVLLEQARFVSGRLDASTSSRIASFQVRARLGDSTLESEARAVVLSSLESISIRIAALGAIGQLPEMAPDSVKVLKLLELEESHPVLVEASRQIQRKHRLEAVN